jgi:GNAT superfamily N-acetyltransferase
MMIFRESKIEDINGMQVVRHSVNENVLSDPSLVTDRDCKDYITVRGKGWVCEIDNTIVGFAIADLQENNIWALFVHPDHEKKGIGKRLHDTMLDWYFLQTAELVWLGTAPGTRAETFYKIGGWLEAGNHGKGEVKFEMTHLRWQQIQRDRNIDKKKLYDFPGCV